MPLPLTRARFFLCLHKMPTRIIPSKQIVVRAIPVSDFFVALFFFSAPYFSACFAARNCEGGFFAQRKKKNMDKKKKRIAARYWKGGLFLGRRRRRRITVSFVKRHGDSSLSSFSSSSCRVSNFQHFFVELLTYLHHLQVLFFLKCICSLLIVFTVVYDFKFPSHWQMEQFQIMIAQLWMWRYPLRTGH